MANDCLASVQACMIRVARLDTDGVPLPGADNLYVSDAIVELRANPNVKAGTEITAENGCGDTCVSYKSPGSTQWWDIELSICKPDPELTELLAGGAVLESGAAVGYGVPYLNEPAGESGVSIELWSKRILNGSLHPTYPYWRWVLPKVQSIVLGERRFFNGALENPFVGQAVENDNWFDGPANDWPVASDRAFMWLPDTGIPDATCGFQSLAAS